MRRWDRIASCFGISLGFLFMIYSLRLNLGRWTEPGPGFLPLCSGMLLFALCLIYGVRAIWIKDDNYIRKESPWPRENLGKLIAVPAALLLFTFFFTTLGYILSTFLLMIFLFRVGDRGNWFLSVIKSALTVLVSYVIFDKWLMIQFPKGFLGS